MLVPTAAVIVVAARFPFPLSAIKYDKSPNARPASQVATKTRIVFKYACISAIRCSWSGLVWPLVWSKVWLLPTLRGSAENFHRISNG